MNCDTVDEQRPTTVVLRHELPDGSWHFDWLLLPVGATADDPNARVVETFRATRRPDGLGHGDRVALERLAPHRAMYLFFEGDIGGGRGCVIRVAWGRLERWRLDDASGEAEILWSGADGVWRTTAYRFAAGEAGVWHVTAEPVAMP